MSISKPSTPDLDLDALIAGETVVPQVKTFTLGNAAETTTPLPEVKPMEAPIAVVRPTQPLQTWQPPIVVDTSRNKRRRTTEEPSVAVDDPVRRLEHELQDLRTRMERIESMVEVFDEPEEEHEDSHSHSHSHSSDSDSDISSDDSEVLAVPEGYEYIYEQISDILVSGDDWLLHEPYVHEMAGNAAIAFYKADQQYKLRAEKMLNSDEREDFRVMYEASRCTNLQTIMRVCTTIKDSLHKTTKCTQMVISAPAHLEARLSREKAAHVKSVNRSNRLRSWAITGTTVCGFLAATVWTYHNYILQHQDDLMMMH